MVCLAFRPQSGQHHLLGRETFLTPVKWETNAWPVVNGNGTIDLNMNVPTLPLKPLKEVSYSTDFSERKLGFEWNYLRNPQELNYTLTERPGFLRLKTTTVKLDDIDSPTFVGRRQEHINFNTTTSLEMFRAQNGDESGISVFMNNISHYDLVLRKEANGENKILLRYRLGEMTHIAQEINIPTGKVAFQVKGESNYYSFAYSLDGKSYKNIGKMDVRFLSTETAGGFTGIYLGLFSTSENKLSKAYTDFDDFTYLPDAK
jgi:alpha-N-arabinofuranosidase